MSEWISVKDAYPGEDMDGVAVIVAVTDSQGDIRSETDAWHKYPGMPNGGVFDFWRSRVICWMPLPPPPTK